MNGPAMHQGIPSAGQPIPPQSFIGGQQPMGILPGAQNPSRAFSMHPGQLPMQQQPPQVVRAGNNVLAPRPPPNGPPGAGHMQQGMPGLGGFPGQMIHQQPPPGAVRRVPSQPHINALGGMPPQVGGAMPMALGPGPQTNLPLRQGQPQTPQQQMQAHNQQQQRMQAAQHQQQQHMFGMHPGMSGSEMVSIMRNPASGGPPSLVRNPSGQVMSSLAQPPPSQGQHPSAIGGPIGGGIGGIGGLGNGMPPPHQTSGNPFPAVPPSQLSPSPRPPSSIVGGPSGAHPHGPHTHPHSHQLSMGGGFSLPGHSVVPNSNNGFLGMASGAAGGPLNMGSGPHHTMGGAQGPRQSVRTAENGMPFPPYGAGSGASQGGAGRPGGNSGNPYTFPSSSSPPIPLGSDGISSGGTPSNRSSFHATTPQFEVNSTSGVVGNSINGGNVNATAGASGAAPGQGSTNNTINSNGNSNISSDLYPSFTMPPPSSIPPRPGSQTPQLQQQQAAAQHQLNQHQQQQLQQHLNQQQQHPHNPQHHPHSSQQHPTHSLPPSHPSHTPHVHHHQLQQQATQHASPPGDVTMGGMYPPRPQSQPQRPPSQASRGTPRTTGTPLPGSSILPNSNGPGTSTINGTSGGNANSNASSVLTSHMAPSNHNANSGPNPSGSSSNVTASSNFSSSTPALGGTPLTQTGIRPGAQQQPFIMGPASNVGAMAGMGNIGTGGMGMSNVRSPTNGPTSGSILSMGSMGMVNVGTVGQGHPPGGLNSGGPGAPSSGGSLTHIAPRPPTGAVSTGPPQNTPTGPAPPANNGATASSIPSAATTAPVPAPVVQRPFAPASSTALGVGQGLVRLLQFSGILASELKTKLKLHWWQDLVKEYFTPNATMKLTLWRDSLRNEAKPFEIGVPILPRFFLVTTQSGVKSMSLTLDGARERSFGQGHSVVECVSAIWTYRYTNGYTITLRGPLTVHVIVTMSTPGNSAQTLRFEEFQFDANLHDKYISIEAISGTRTVDPGGLVSSTDEEEEDIKWEEPRVFISQAVLAGEPVNAFGIPQATMRCLELAESVSSMADLIEFAHDNEMGPLDALKAMANRLRASNQAAVQQQEQQQQQQQQHYVSSTSAPPGNVLSAPSNSTTLDSFAPSYSQPPNGVAPSNTLYSSAPSSVTNPQQSGPTPGPPSNMNSPGTASSSGNSPEKQLKSIPQSNQQGQPQASGSGSGQQGQSAASASSPAISSGGTTTPALSNTSLKRKHQGDASSPTVANADQPKRPSRKKGRTSTSGAPG